MLYYFELQMAGVILLTTMLIAGISLWYRRRKTRLEGLDDTNDTQNI